MDFVVPDFQNQAVVILTRHGQTDLNAAGLMRGRLDPALDSRGESEVAALGRDLAQFLGTRAVARIVTSPLRRAVDTALAIAGALRVRPSIQVEQLLNDRDYGQWAGRRRQEVESLYGTIDAAPGVEPAADVAHRAFSVLEGLLPLAVNEAVVLVAHDAVNRSLLTVLDPALGPSEDIAQATACWNLLSYREDAWHVLLVNQEPAHAT